MSLPGIDTVTILVLEAVAIAAYFLKGFSGFGPALVLVPVVSTMLTPQLGIANSAIIDLCVGVGFVMYLDYGLDDIKQVGKMAVFVVGGTVLGGVFAGIVPSSILLACIGGVVLMLAVFLLVTGDASLAYNGSGRILYTGSFLGGVTGGLVGISGPFIVAAAKPVFDKARFRKILVAIFLVAGVFKVGTYWFTGVMTGQALTLAAFLGPAVLAGLWIGNHSHMKVSELVFNRAVAAILLLLSVQILYGLLV